MKRELANGAALTSLIGYTLSYNSLDNNKGPTQGIMTEFKQDFAGAGGDVKFIRTSADVWGYHEVASDIVAPASAGRAHYGMGRRRDARPFPDGPEPGPGFAPAGIGPRDHEYPGPGSMETHSAARRTGVPALNFRRRCILPKDTGVKVAAFADAGSLWTYVGRLHFPPRARCFRERRVPPGARASPTLCNAQSTTLCIFAPRSASD